MIPTDISGCVLWFDASQLGLADGAPVSPWPNLATPAMPGTMVGSPAPVIRTNALNGLPVVRFTHDLGRMRMSSTGIGLDWTIAYVARQWGTVPGRIVTGIYTPANILVGWWTSQQDVAYDEGFMTPNTQTAWTTDWKLYSADGITSGPLTRFFGNGVLLGTASTSQGWKGTFGISGYDATGVQETCDCEVAEIAFYNRRLFGGERTGIDNYLRQKWLIPKIPRALDASPLLVPTVNFQKQLPTSITLAADLALVSSLRAVMPPAEMPSPKWIQDMGLDDPEIISAGRELAKPKLLSVRLDSR